jgi:hypothetical protein
MKAISVVPGTKTVRLVDRPEPSISVPNEIKVRVLRLAFAALTARRLRAVAPRHHRRTKIWC